MANWKVQECSSQSYLYLWKNCPQLGAAEINDCALFEWLSGSHLKWWCKKWSKELSHSYFEPWGYFSFELFCVGAGGGRQEACGILVPCPRIKLVPSTMERQHFNHWTARKVPPLNFPFFLFFFSHWTFQSRFNLQSGMQGATPFPSLTQCEMMSPKCSLHVGSDHTGTTYRARPFSFSYVLFWPSLVAQSVKNPPATQETQVQFLVWEDPLEKEMALQYSCLAKSHSGQRSQVGYSPWGCKSQTWFSN